MVSYPLLGSPKRGNLGNQLFQLASTIGTAMQRKTTAHFPHWKHAHEFDFPKCVKFGELPDLPPFHEPNFGYSQLPNGHALGGWLQSEKYFPKQPFKLKGIVKQPNTIAVSIRRGDYVNNPNYFQLPITWYINAIMQVPDWQNKTVLFFSDDIEYCKVHFECITNAVFATGTPIEQLRQMAGCEWFVIANSTFSWWGAYLSGSNNVIHCGQLFRGGLLTQHPENCRDFYPERWQVCDKLKLDLSDVTFTIPVKYDSKDRKQNIDLSVCMLQRDYDCNIHVMEQGGDYFRYFDQWCKYSQVQGAKFHRTKMLNDMAVAARTPIVCNYDCDVFIPPMQMWMAVDAIRNGAPIAYPYDGRFARMPRREWFTKLEQTFDIGTVGNTQFKGKYGNPMPTSSVGGCLLYNRRAFIDAGMENERMISYAPEDAERWDRFHALGLDVRRIGGALYHMDHWIGPDSSKRHGDFYGNYEELLRIRSLSGDELRKEVKIWPWVQDAKAKLNSHG
jgi:hypothetical protein